MNRSEFMEQMAQAAYWLKSFSFDDNAPGYRLDADKAWEAYETDPGPRQVRTEDNPEGDPVVALILEDGPWWVTE